MNVVKFELIALAYVNLSGISRIFHLLLIHAIRRI